MLKDVSKFLLVGMIFFAPGCVKRSYNSGKSSAKSENSGSALKTFKCHVVAPILPDNGPKGKADFGDFKVTLDSSAQPPQIKIEKLGSFKQWVEVGLGTTKVSELQDSVTEGAVKSVVMQGWGREYRFKIILDAGQNGEATFYLAMNEKLERASKFTDFDEDANFKLVKINLYPKDYGTNPGKAMDLLLGQCADGTVEDDGLRGELSNLASSSSTSTAP